MVCTFTMVYGSCTTNQPSNGNLDCKRALAQ